MVKRSKKGRSRDTAKLTDRPHPAGFAENIDISYRPIPHSDRADGQSQARPVWRVRIDVVSQDPIASFGLDVNDVVILGRGEDIDNLVDLTAYDAANLGVSRRHLMLRPSDTNLYVSDLGSTNGSHFNGIPIGVNSPYSLTGKDLIELGALQLSVTVEQRPKTDASELRKKADLTDALLKIGKTITSQLEFEEVLRQVLTMAKSSTSASVATIWLVDEKTNELFLEAELDVDNVSTIRRRRLLDSTTADEVARTGKPLRVKASGRGGKARTAGDTPVEAAIYMPLVLGGITLGVLSVAHRNKKKDFTDLDEKLLTIISEFAAIAIQNSRLVRATDRFLSFHVERLDALNQMATAISASLSPREFYDVLVDLIREHWPAEKVKLWILDDSEKILIPFEDLTSGKDTKLIDLPKIGEGPLGEAAQTGEPVIIKGSTDLAAAKTPKEISDDDKGNTLTLDKPTTLAHIPLHIKGRVVAVVTLHITGGKPFTTEDIHRLQTATGMAAVAIQNTLLLTQSENQSVIVKATADLLPHPLLIVNNQGELIISNQAAEQLLTDWQKQWRASSPHLNQYDQSIALTNLIKELSGSVGRTKEIEVADQTYLSTIEHDTQVGTIILLQDVTELRRLERIRADFIGTLAHDVRGPLTSIRGFARLLNDERIRADESRVYVGEIIQSTERVIDMIEQLLNIELLGSPEPELAEVCDLVDTIDKAVTDLKGVALEKGIDLHKQISGTPFEINASSTLLYRSVLNLIDNAIKYSPRNSTVHIELKFAQDEVAIIVRDEGRGIPERDMHRIFDKYFRIEDVDQTIPGSGLGLAMVNATATRFGGKVTVRNTEKGGAEFTITLPREIQD